MSTAKAQALYVITVVALGGSIVVALWRGC